MPKKPIKKIKNTLPLKVQAFVQDKYYKKKRPVVKTSDKPLDAERLLPFVFDNVRKENKVYRDMKGILSDQIIDDILFSKVTANYKEFEKQFGEPFRIAYQAYKRGRGAKTRKEIAKFTRKKYEEEKALDLNKRIDEMLKKARHDNPNPKPDNPYMRYEEGEWVDYSPSALAERIKAERDDAVKKVKDEESRKALNSLAEFTLRLQKIGDNTRKPLEKLNEPINKLKESFVPLNKSMEQLKKGTEPLRGLLGQPITNRTLFNAFNPFAFSVDHKKPQTILGAVRPVRVPNIKPDGSKRNAVTGTGLNTYMTYHNLTNPVDIAKKFTTKEGKKVIGVGGKERDYTVGQFHNLRFICEQMNVNVEEAFLYICEGMKQSKERWRKHRLDKEFWRGSQSVVNLVKYHKEQVDIAKKDKNKMAYTVKMLWQSPYCKNLFLEFGVAHPDYTQFSKWYKKMKHHVEVLKLDKPQQPKK